MLFFAESVLELKEELMLNKTSATDRDETGDKETETEENGDDKQDPADEE